MTKNYIKFKNRIILVHVIVMLVWIGFGFRLFNIQIINKINNPQGIKVETVNGLRGNFYDINGESLTQNLTFYRIGVHLNKIPNIEKFSEELSSCTGTNQETYINKLNDGKDYIELEKKTNKNCESLQKRYPNALNIKKSFKRYYPEENLLSQIIGFTSIDDKGISGLELKYNSELEPTNGSKVSKRNGLGKRISDPTLPSQNAKNGTDIFLTIDKRYQAILRNELIEQVEKVGASSGRGLIINPINGAILAMVNVPDYNPNFPNNYDIELQKNKIVTDLIEPGSTFKVVTMAAAIEEKVPISKTFPVKSPWHYKEIKWIEDTIPQNEPIDLKEILKYSSNIGTIKIAEEIGRKKLYLQAKEFGFGRKTGFDINSEPNGTLKDSSSWTESSMHSIPLGYEVSATPLQIAMAYASIANGGYILEPIIRKKGREEGVNNLDPKRPRRILTIKNATALKRMLEFAVDEKHKAFIEGWNVAGKTGTSKKVINNTYSDSEFISSFVGFLPADKPQLLCIIILDGADASLKMHYGAESAAPVFKSVIERILSLDDFSVLKRGKAILASNKVEVENNESKREIIYVTMPDLIGKDKLEAAHILRKVGLKTAFRSGSGFIKYQSLKGGEEISPGDKVEIGTRIYLKAEMKE